EEHDRGKLRLALDNRDFVQVAGRPVWLPKTSETQWYTFDSEPSKIADKPILVETLTVTALDPADLPDDQFVVKFEPGYAVADRRLKREDNPKAAVMYRTPADATKLQEAVERAQNPVGRRSEQGLGWLRPYLLGGAAVLAAAAAVLVLCVYVRRGQAR